MAIPLKVTMGVVIDGQLSIGQVEHLILVFFSLDNVHSWL